LTCGPRVDTGYRSTAVLRIASATTPSTRPTDAPTIELSDPVTFALGRCDAASAESNLRSGPGIGFAAKTNAAGDLLSLTAVAPTPAGADALAREWAIGFVYARRAEAKDLIRDQERRLELHVERLHRELRAVDTTLARLMPVAFGDVLRFDSPHSLFPGAPTRVAAPPLPENATAHERNLAFERIQLLAEIELAAKQARGLRVAAAKTDAYASVVSQSPARSIRAPHHGPNATTVLFAIALLVGGALLAGAAIRIGRRRRAQAP
jgi:hypothetical protein